MLEIALICLLSIGFLDIRYLRKADRDLFRHVISIPKRVIFLFSLLTALVVISTPNKLEAVSAFVYVFYLPAYLVRRRRFLKSYRATTLSARYEYERLPALEESVPQEAVVNIPSKGQPLSEQDKFYMASDAYGLILIWTFSGVIISVVIGALMNASGRKDLELAEMVISGFLSSVLLLIFIRKVSGRFSSRGFLYNIGLVKGPYSLIKIVLLPALIGLCFAGISLYLVFTRKVVPQTPLSEVIEATQSSSVILAFLALAVLVAPLVEEIVFRGYFFHVLSRLKGLKFAVIVISLSFAFLHVGQYWGDWMAIFVVTVLGFVLTILRTWSQTTIASTVMHYVYNGGITLIPVIAVIVTNPPYFKYQAYYDYLTSQQKEALLKESIRRQPDLAEAYNNLAWLYLEEGKDLKQALQWVDKALSHHPNEKAYLDTKASILEKLNMVDEAKDTPDDPLSSKN